MSIACYLSGIGASTPAHVLTNQDIEKLVDTTHEWIESRTGIQSRHVLDEGEQATDLAAEAARRAIAASGWAMEDITHVLTATATPEYLCPNASCLVAARLGLGTVAALDINAACSGFLYGIDLARGLVTTTPGARILIIGVEGVSRRLNWKDRGTCVLFGDGAGATVVSADIPPGGDPTGSIDDVLCCSDGSQGEALTVGGGTHRSYISGVSTVDDDFFVAMSGREVFKYAVRNMTGICRTILDRNGLTLDDVDLFIPHQANLRIIEAVSDRMGVDPAKVFVNIQTMGNTSSASIPLAMNDAWANGALRPGMRVLFVTFGGGFTWAASLMRF
ncbi:MAG: ketoacyl-ACP synthase III [Deltaproteobacteria bacterium]|nr:ketoacyl-ACP synthase III [Deltaproteobacteria bacterium]